MGARNSCKRTSGTIALMRQWLPGQGAWGQLDEVLTRGSFLCEVVSQLLGVPPALRLVCVQLRSRAGGAADGPNRDLGPPRGPSLFVGLHDNRPNLELTAPLRGVPPFSPLFFSWLSLWLGPGSSCNQPRAVGPRLSTSQRLPYQLDFSSYSILLENVGPGVLPPPPSPLVL